MKNLKAMEILRGLWNNNESWAKEINDKISFIIDYANDNRIYWCDGNTKLHKVLKFSKRVYRHFNDGDALRFINFWQSEEIQREIVFNKIALINDVYNKLKKININK